MDNTANTARRLLLLHICEAVILLLTVFFVITVYASAERISDATCEEVAAAVLGEELAAPDRSVAGTRLEFERNFGVSADDYDGVIYYKPESGMDVTEIIIAKSSSADAREELVSALEAHLTQRRDVFQGYAPEQYALLMEAGVVESDGFVFCAVGKDADKMYDLFYKAVRD